MKSQMTIGKKLMLSFGAVLALMLGLSYSSLTAVGTLGNHLSEMANKTARKVDLAGEIRASAAEMRGSVREMILVSALKDTAEFDKARQAFNDSGKIVAKAIAEARPMLVTERGKRAADRIEEGLANWSPLVVQIAELCAKGQLEEAYRVRKEKQKPIANDVKKASEDILEINRELLVSASKDGAQAAATSRWIAFVLIGICLAVGVGVVFIVRQISSTLRQIAGEMADGAQQVAAAAGQVSSSSQSLAQGSSEQAASIEETSASSEEINSMARKNAENSKFAADNMVEAAQRVEEANRNLEQMVTSMNEINASSEKISKIIKVIDEIAFQTNILALNAAVEAARAGEAGMGFAVVADEVRNLAQRCAQAAKDTAGLIEESISKSNDGKTKLEQVAKAVGSITDSATKVKTLVDEVKLGSEEQARGIEQVAKAITQMEKVTQTTAANAEESASASEELSAQSDTLRAIVARLNGMVGGGSEAVHSVSHAKTVHHASARKRAAAMPSAALLAKPVNFHQEPVAVSVTGDKSSFPLEGDFKEF